MSRIIKIPSNTTVDLSNKLDKFQTAYHVKNVQELLEIHPANVSNQIELGNAIYYFDSLDFDLGVYTLITYTDTAIHGYSQLLNQISSSQDNIDMITSIGGNLFIFDIRISCTGVNSKALNMVGTGVESLDMKYVELGFGTNGGSVEGVRQFFWFGGFGIGGKGFLLKGAIQGARISSTRLINMEYVLKGDDGFTCNNIRSDANVTIPTGNFAYDFDFNMFNVDGGYQLSGGFYDGGGEMTAPFTLASGSTTTITKDSSKSFFRDNEGEKGMNTKPKGSWAMQTEIPTVFTSINSFVKIQGITNETGSVHFQQTESNSVEYIVDKIKDFSLTGKLIIRGTRNNIISIQVRKINTVNSTSEVVKTYTQSIDNFVGNSDFSTFLVLADLSLSNNDKIEYWAANLTGTNPITLTISSESIIK